MYICRWRVHYTDRLVVVLVHGDSEEIVEVVLQLLLPGVHLVRLQHRVGLLGEAGQGGPAATSLGQLFLFLLFGLKFEIHGQMLRRHSSDLETSAF